MKRLLSTSTSSTAEAAGEVVQRYGFSLRWLHIIQGVAAIGAIGSVNAAMRQPKTPEGQEQRGQIMIFHKSCGTLIFATLPIRFLVRAVAKTPPHLPAPKVLQFAASASHLVLYGGLLFMSTTGILMGYYGGRPVYFFNTTFDIKADPVDKPMMSYFYKIHKQVGFWWQFMVPLHIGGTAFHMVQGHRILARVNPFVW